MENLKSGNLKSYIFDKYVLNYAARKSIIFKVFGFFYAKDTGLEVCRNLHASNIRNKCFFLIYEVNNA